MVFNNCVYIPDKIWNDIISPESRECVLDLAMECHRIKSESQKEKTIIKELEQKVDDLQKALDVVLQNKCRTRKVKVKYIGRL